MKTLLLRPIIDDRNDNYPPISLMYLSSYLKSKNLEVTLLDMDITRSQMGNFSNSNPFIDKMVRMVKNINPDIIGMTLFSRELKEYYHICRILKHAFPNTYLLFGGPHPTVSPLETLEQIPDCDMVASGESELILYELISALSSGRDLNAVKGLSYRSYNSAEIVQNAKADIISDINALPFPDRKSLLELYNVGRYKTPFFGKLDNIMTSRSCAFNCHFCSKVSKTYRSRTPENVIREIDWIMEHISPRTIQIMDDSFTLQHARCENILDMMIEKQYPCNFRVRSRTDAVDDGLLKKMKRAGVTTVVYGFESGSQKMLDAFNKGTKVEQNIEACRLTRKNKLNCFGDFMLFYPGETRETLRETEDFIKRAKPTLVKLAILAPLPGTKVYEDALKENRLIGRYDVRGETPWIRLGEFDSVPKMEKYIKKLRLRVLLNLRRILWILWSFGGLIIMNPKESFFYLMSQIFPVKMRY